MGATCAPGASPGGWQNAPAAPRGRKKIHCHLPGALRRNFPARFHPPRGSRGALWARFWEPLGLILALRLATGVQNAKISIFANGPHENLDFQGSGGHFWNQKPVQKQARSEDRAHAHSRSLKIASRALLESLRGPKKNFGNFQKRPRGILERFWQKTRIGVASGRPWSAVLARPVKAYPGGFRPGKTRLNDFKHARHRKRWSA